MAPSSDTLSDSSSTGWNGYCLKKGVHCSTHSPHKKGFSIMYADICRRKKRSTSTRMMGLESGRQGERHTDRAKQRGNLQCTSQERKWYTPTPPILCNQSETTRSNAGTGSCPVSCHLLRHSNRTSNQNCGSTCGSQTGEGGRNRNTAQQEIPASFFPLCTPVFMMWQRLRSTSLQGARDTVPSALKARCAAVTQKTILFSNVHSPVPLVATPRTVGAQACLLESVRVSV